MGMGQGVRTVTGLGYGGIICVLQTQFSSCMYVTEAGDFVKCSFICWAIQIVE